MSRYFFIVPLNKLCFLRIRFAKSIVIYNEPWYNSTKNILYKGIVDMQKLYDAVDRYKKLIYDT